MRKVGPVAIRSMEWVAVWRMRGMWDRGRSCVIRLILKKSETKNRFCCPNQHGQTKTFKPAQCRLSYYYARIEPAASF